ncbi:MAG: sugar ABC transporter ATP-binding protein [Actinomycetota bacterium]|nr:sugar ABC transporter ATP-binding protein [Actinomycetota bacterium]
MTDKATPRIEVRSISKTFGVAKVLDAVDLSVSAGEIHGLIGQNGSGKSTLVKILTGYHRPSSGGSLHVDGKIVRLPVRWRDAHAAGMSVVHQDLGLLDQLSVAENICVGGYVTSGLGRRIHWKEQRRIAQRVLTRLEVHIDPAAPVGLLSAAERAEVAIARALRDVVPGSGLIILDESTRALGRAERGRFHGLLRRVVETGSSVLMVSHDLEEVLEITDRVTVLRDGRLAGNGLSSRESTEADLARRMMGKDVIRLASRAPSAPTTAAVRIRGLRGGSVSGLDLTIGQGEVVGLTGLPGNGFEEIPYLLSGARPAIGGTIEIGSRSLNLAHVGVGAIIRAGIVLVPERRDRDGLAFDLSVRDNISLPTLKAKGRPWFVGRGWQEAKAQEAIERLDIRPNAPRQLVKEMSGGNQQKVLLAKWLTTAPKIMILHEPTQGVDIGARQDILRAIHQAADSGIAVLMVGVEASDLVAVCERILVYSSEQPLEEVRTTSAENVLDVVYSSSTNKHAKERT